MLTSNPQRLAWITVVGALAIFCLLCFSAYALGRWFVFESPVQMSTVLHVGKGTVGLAEPGSDEKVVRTTDTVARNDTMRTDGLSQGYLEFSDPYTGEVVATVLLRSDSSMKLNTARRPRFNLSDDPYIMQVTEVSGRVEVWVAEGLDREVLLEIKSSLGTLHITEPGFFFIASNETLEMTAMPRIGTATLISTDGAAHHLAESTEGRIVPGEPAIQTQSGVIDLLSNWNFDEGDWAKYWICGNEFPVENPNGPEAAREFKLVDGRSVIHIERMQPEPGPNSYRCIQGQNWPVYLDVSSYETLRLRVTMQVHHQSLSACGVAGTECPVMLFIKYIDGDGNLREWYHGFYARYEPSLGGRKICDACLAEHEFINKDGWYTYESGNLFTDLPLFTEPADQSEEATPQDRRVKEIAEIHFYSGGHQYDVMLSEVALIATLGTDDMTAISDGD